MAECAYHLSHSLLCKILSTCSYSSLSNTSDEYLKYQKQEIVLLREFQDNIQDIQEHPIIYRNFIELQRTTCKIMYKTYEFSNLFNPFTSGKYSAQIILKIIIIIFQVIQRFPFFMFGLLRNDLNEYNKLFKGKKYAVKYCCVLENLSVWILCGWLDIFGS